MFLATYDIIIFTHSSYCKIVKIRLGMPVKLENLYDVTQSLIPYNLKRRKQTEKCKHRFAMTSNTAVCP